MSLVVQWPAPDTSGWICISSGPILIGSVWAPLVFMTIKVLLLKHQAQVHGREKKSAGQAEQWRAKLPPKQTTEK
jgi:phosphotransferase system  glucose/maltose/N-acetylglucosamine-specific IIC component